MQKKEERNVKKRPNIVIFNPDQMRYDALGHMGVNPGTETPFLDEMIREDAVSYRYAFCQNPVCTPSRCSFFTGLYPHVHGHRTMRHMLHRHESSLLSELKEAGYYVWMNTRNDLLPGQDDDIFSRHATEIFYGGNVPPAPGPVNPGLRGKPGSKYFYSHYKGELATDERGLNYTPDDEAVDAAIDRLKSPADDRPLCIFLGLIYPHPPYRVEEPYYSRIDREKVMPRIAEAVPGDKKPLFHRRIREELGMQDFTEEDYKELRGVYYGMCSKIDAEFKRLCDGLKEAGIYEDTAIFFLSDHGDYTGDYGIVEKAQNMMEDCLVRVPLLIKPPKDFGVDAGISDQMVELVDFYRTAMAFADVAPDHSQFGRKLQSNLADRSVKVRDYVCSEGGRNEDEIHCDEFHDDKNLPTVMGEYYPRQKLQTDSVIHGKAAMIRNEQYKYIRRIYEDDEFYDLRLDPQERMNRIHVKEYAEIIMEMKELLLDWYQKTCDVVPFEKDDRHSKEMIRQAVKNICPPEYKAEVERMIENREGTLFEIRKYCEEAARRT